ncbi:MAG TPA: CotH kinase family protein [Bacteroidia bacterium]
MLKLSIAAALLLAVLLPFQVFFITDDKKNDSPLKLSPQVTVPECSMESGFYDTELTVKLGTIPGQRIFYSLDGSEPSMLSEEYKEPVIILAKNNASNELSLIPTSPRWKPPISDVFKGTVLRAIAVDEKNNKKSAEVIRTFFIDGKGRSRYSLPVFSITANKKDLFGHNNGIYVLGKNYGDKNQYAKKNIRLDLPWWEYPSNYLEKGDDSERPVNIDFIEKDAKGFTASAGIRIHGNATRGFAQKSLRVSFRAKYGQEALVYPLFKGSVKRIQSFVLRNSGNDWDKTMFRDGFMQSLMKKSNLDIQEYRPSIVFINGEYWGIHNIRERFDEDYLVNKYLVSKDSICILEMSGLLAYGKKEDEKTFKKLLDFIKTRDLSDKNNYEYICSKLDLESFCDFLIANIYFCNSDWPNNNVKFWRYKSESGGSSNIKDGKWRWMLYDTDWGFGYNNLSTPDNNLLEKARTTGSVGILFNGLLQNNEFKEKFIDRFQEHLNTTFYPPHVISLIDEMQQELAPEMQEHINRWRVIGSYRQWMSNVEVLRDYARKRPAFQIKQLNDFFDLPEGKRLLERK